jgi:hypothetical protein
MSYNGSLAFGLLADYDAMPDLDEVATYIEDAITELLEVSKPSPGHSAATNGRAAETPASS